MRRLRAERLTALRLHQSATSTSLRIAVHDVLDMLDRIERVYLRRGGDAVGVMQTFWLNVAERRHDCVVEDLRRLEDLILEHAADPPHSL
jgi:hypothetical protein